MRRKSLRKLRQLAAYTIVASMLLQQTAYALPKAETRRFQSLPEHANKSEFAEYDTFYLASTEAELKEGGSYLLRVERGGNCEEAASVILKFSDITASYDTDYMVRLHDGFRKEKADVPKDNQSMLEQIREAAKNGQTETGMTEEGQKQAKQAYLKAYESLRREMPATGSDAVHKATDSNAENKATDSNAVPGEDDWLPDSTAQPFFDETGICRVATGSSLSLQEAKSALLGEESDRRTLAGGRNTVVQALSDFSDTLLTGLNGATLEVPFEAGEKSVQVEIITFDNDLSDGNRMFNVVLTEPSDGYTSSAVSDGIFTICDDEEAERIFIGFGESVYHADEDRVYVDVYREGALNQAVSVGIVSEAVTAVSGKDFSPVRAEIFFPFGIEKRTLEIPVQRAGLTEDVSFLLKLQTKEKQIELTLEEAEVWISPEEATAADGFKASDTGEAEICAAAAGERGGTNIGLQNDTAQKKYTGLILPDVWGDYSEVRKTDDGAKLKGTKDGQGATVAFTAGNQYAYDGCSFEWKKSSAKPNYSEQKIDVQLESEAGWKTLYQSDEARWANRRTELRFNGPVNQSVHFNFYRDYALINRTDEEEIKNFQWIYRKFNVHVLPAAEIPKFLGEDGRYHADPQAAEVSVEGNASTKVLYTKPGYNRIAITKKSDKVRLIGLEILKNSSDAGGRWINLNAHTPDSWTENGNTIIIELSDDFLRAYCSPLDPYISYTTDKKTKETCGDIYLRPVFGYYDTEVHVKDSAEVPNAGQITVRRQNDWGVVEDQKLAPGTVLKLHKGDQPRFSVSVNGDREKILTGSGIYVDSRLGGGRKNDQSIRLLQNGCCFLEKDPLRENRYDIEPVYAFRGNGIRVRIHEDDLAKFADSGIFAKDAAGKYLAPYKVENGIYEFYPGGDDAVSGAVYTLIAEPKDSSRAAVWKKGGDYYAGNTLSHTGRASAADNLIELYAADDLKKVTVDVGEIYYQNRTLRNLSNTEAGTLPAKGASFVLMGQTAVAGTDGKLQLSQETAPAAAQTYTGFAFDVGTSIYPLLTSADGTVRRSTQAEDVTNHRLHVQYTMNCDSVSRTEELSLSKADVQKGHHLLGRLEIDALMYDGPHFENLTVTREGLGCETVLMQRLARTDFQVAVRGDGQSYTYYENGKQITAQEHVTAVSLLVLDKGGKELHSVELQKNKGTGLWSGSEFFAPGNGYYSGDRIYLQMTTDRRTGLPGQSYVYRPVDTGYLLYEEEGEPEDPQELNFGELGSYGALPLIGSFNTTMDLGYVRLGVEALRDDRGKVYGTRLSIGGKRVPEKLASANHGLGDDQVNYGGTLDKLKNIRQTAKAAWNSTTALHDLAKTSPELAAGAAASLGAPQWAFTPRFGFYMDFTMRGAGTDDAGNELSQGGLKLCGGGVFAGLSGELGMNSYFLVPVVFIPCYFGTKVDGDIQLQFGAKAKFDVNYKDMTKPDINLADPKLMKYTGVQTFQANIQVHGGIGIAGVIGVRGLTRVETMFMLAQNYFMDEKNDSGFELALKIGLEIDALLATIPFTYTVADAKTGLLQKIAAYESADKENAGKKRTLAEPLASASDAAYALKERNGRASAWQGADRKRSGFGEMEAWTLQKNGFDRPDGKFMELEDGNVIYLFLADDPELPEDARTVLVYSVFDGKEFSRPLKIQGDGKADFTPTLCSVGNDVMIAWMSAGREDNDANGEAVFGTEEVLQQEIYSLRVSKKALLEQAAANDITLAAFNLDAAGAKIERLTNDSYYDSNPVLVYEETTGTVFAFYLKTEAKKGVTDANLIDYVNPMDAGGKTYSTIVYKQYDPNTGWQGAQNLDEDADSLLKLFDGQCFLLSSINDEYMQQLDPVIADLSAAAVGGEIFLAYTVDTDQNIDTDRDRDIYMQWMYPDPDKADRIEWISSEPVRITEADKADALPQLLVRNGARGSAENVWLFWLSEGRDIMYFDVDEFERLHWNMEAGEDEPGNALKDEAGNPLNEAVLIRESSHMADISKEENREFNLAGFKAAVDGKDNVYLLWTDAAETEEGEFCQELYAMGLLETEGYQEVPVAQNNGDDTVIEYPEDGEVQTVPREKIRTWSLPNRLTHTGEIIDDPVFMVNRDGRMLVCYNQYRMEVDAEDEKNPVKLSGYKHQAAVLKPVGSVETKEIVLSDDVPMAGQEVEVTVKTVNRGMLTAKDGYSVTVYEETGDGTRKEIESWTGGTGKESLLIPAAEQEHSFIWTVPKQVDGTRLVVESKELGFDTVHITESEALTESKVYGLYNIDAHQLPDGSFAVDLELENSGNRASDPGDYILVRFDGPFGTAADFGIEEEILGKLEISLEPGERRTYRVPFAVEEQAFDMYGFIDVNVNVRNHDDSNTEERAIDRCFLYRPVEVTVNGKHDKLVLREGESLALSAEFGESERFADTEITYISEDNEIFAAGENSLTAHRAGEAGLRVYLEGYDSCYIIQVQVLPAGSGGEDGHEGSGSGSSEDSGSRWYGSRNAEGELLMAGNGAYRFRKNDGSYAKAEWQKLGDSWYYFGEDTFAAKGWVQTWSGWYYLDPESAVMHKGWLFENNRWYCLHPELGYMMQGWQFINGKWYYLNFPNGDMQTGWLYVNDRWYYLNPESGAMETGWQQIGGKWYYLDPQNGDMHHGSIVEEKYRLSEDGHWIEP